MRRDRVDFVLTENDEGLTFVEPHINGESLAATWRRRTRSGGEPIRAADALWSGRSWWLDEPLRESGSAEQAVLADVDGLVGCGGAVVDIEIGADVVVWRRFRQVPGGEVVDLGPFTFGRDAYEGALKAAQARLRR